MASSAPAMPPPGYEADEDRGPSFLAFCIVMTIVALLSVCLRFYSRSLYRPADQFTSRFSWDDWFILAATPFMVGSEVLAFVMIHLGLGKHIWNMAPQNIIPFLKILFATEIIYDIGLCLAKESVLLFYARVFSTRQSPVWFRVGLYTTHAINISWLLGVIFGTVFQCSPVAKTWNPSLPGTCATTSALYLGSAIPSVVIDLILLVLPLPMIWGLNLTRGRKAALTLIFMMGYSVIVISIGRVVTLTTREDEINSDFPYQGITVLYWLAAEIPVTILSICLPAMSHLGHRVYSGMVPITSKMASLLGSRSSGSRQDQSLDSHSNRRPSQKETDVGSRSASADYNSAGYKVYAAHSIRQSESSSTRDSDTLELNDRDIHVKNGFTVAGDEP